MTLILLLNLYMLITYAREEVKHIGSHKFRFNDEILDLSRDVNINRVAAPDNQSRANNNFKNPQKLFKKYSLLKLKKMNQDNTNTQSIGYTTQDYPNPGTNPNLCLHNYSTKSHVCDPDGILTEEEQRNMNRKLSDSDLDIFVTLSQNIFVETGVSKSDAQTSFANKILKKYSETFHCDYNKSILLSYVKEFETLKIVSGEDMIGKKIKPELISKLEEEFQVNQKELYKSLNVVIEKIIERIIKTDLIFTVLITTIVVAILVIGGLFIFYN
ncbi:putative integral membrane protein [Theileria parva strain Muguga]|uniref:putative integral membrane protein n=1 Tax=Theileria parva strain Muguga TaxID=333668 RepID=UPI001C618136|nr:putative integral membrane protein [Theileria parva strain Muguga]EAN34193.2 putative integral membrane protein [Theileria parva strain Muguga]